MTSDIAKVLKSIGTQQDQLHKVAVVTSIYALNWKDTSGIIKLLDGLYQYKTSTRIEALVYWFKHVAGMNVKQKDDGSFEVKFAKDTFESDVNVNFTYDVNHMASIRDTRLAFYAIAPVKVVELKLCDITKVTQSAEIQLARALAAGSITDEQVLEQLQGMMTRIQERKLSKTTKDWLSKYNAQVA